MEILFGLETEIGITRRDATDLDVVAESIALVRAAPEVGVRLRWDYALEDPHLDTRGFRVDELRQDTDEANYVARDQARRMSWSEIKSDLVLCNGARFYNDHAHPEYCTPECSTLLELLQQDHAGEELLMACARGSSGENPVILYKNNTDFCGHSYGCHENYLLPRRLPWSTLAAGMEAFLVTRQIFCGAGKFGWEDEDHFLRAGFQIAQRSDFFSELQSVDTMQRRPIINTRDEPHADPAQWRRFHVIIGDANLSPFATWLKVGTAALVLRALLAAAAARQPVEFPRLGDPIGDLKRISRDAKWRWPCTLSNGAESTAIDVQRRYIELVERALGPLVDDYAAVLVAWREVLDDLSRDPLSTADRLDWSAKFKLIESFRAAENLEPDDPWLRSLDLAYHQLDVTEGLFFGLRESGAFRFPFPRQGNFGQGLKPPSSTRAAIRGSCIEKFGSDVVSANWDSLVLRDAAGLFEIDLRALFDPAEVAAARELVVRAKDAGELRKLPFAKAR